MRPRGKATDPVTAALAARTRGELKAAGAWLDEAGEAVRAELVARAAAEGHAAPPDWAQLDGRRLLRALLDRAAAAQVRSTPIARDEAFACAHCGRDVPLGGRRPRDHCPWCLYSRHVDVVPGDRAADCGGLLVPVGVESSRKGMMLVYRCSSCSAVRRNRVLDDLQPPDAPAAVLALVRARPPD
jgi:DNA-directed RNA polymerase subunit RPC12/RpoP